MPTSFLVVGGSGQSTPVNTAFTQELAVFLFDDQGQLLPDTDVTFTAPAGNPATTPTAIFDGTTNTITVKTDINGRASVDASRVTAGAKAGQYNVVISAGPATPDNIELINAAGDPASIDVFAGGGQQAEVLTTLPIDFVAIVTDAYGNPVVNQEVTFTAPGFGPGGSFGGSLTITALTDSLGHAKASAFSLNAISGPFNISANLTTGPLPQDANFGVISLPGPPASIALVQGSAQSTQVTTAFATALKVVVKDAQGNVVPNLDVTFTAPASGASGTFANATATTTVKTDASGIATATTFTANALTGTYTVTAAYTGGANVNFSLTNTPAPVNGIAIDSGSPQTTTVTRPFANDLAVKVSDSFGNAISGVTVQFQAPASGASATLSASSAVTDSTGVASVTATANGTAGGPYDVTASIAGGAAVDFKLTNVDPYSIELESGSPQETTITTAFANPLRALVKDENGTPIPGITVTFTAPSSGASGSFSNSSTTITATTDANGIASVPVTANGTAGGFSVSASVQGPAAPASFLLTNLNPDSIAINGGNNQQATINTNYPQSLSAVVKDAQGAGIPGMTVTFTAPGSGASGVFSNNTATITAVTNASGIASVPVKANATVGPFNVAAAVTGIATPVAFGLTNLEPIASTATISGGNNQVTAVCSNFSNALSVTIKDVNGLVIANYPVTYTVVPNGGATGTFSNSTGTITTNSNASGVASSGTLTAGCTAGNFTVTAQAGPVTQTFNLTILQPDTITITGGGTQSTAIGTNFSNNLQVRVTATVNGSPVIVPNATVTFTAPGSGPSAGFTSAITSNVTTNANGIASRSVRANANPGSYQVTASVSGISTSANFNLTNLQPSTVSVTPNGTPQRTIIGTAFANVLEVLVVDGNGTPVPNATVTFSAPGSGASATLSNTTRTTNASGKASITATANGTNGSYLVTATVTGAGSTTFSLTNFTPVLTVTLGSPQSAVVDTNFGSILQVKLTDDSNTPLPNYIINFTAPVTGPHANFTAPVNVTTNASGLASTTVKANTVTGSYLATATLSANTSIKVTFDLTNTPGPARTITVVSGSGQSAPLGSDYGAALVAVVKDDFGNVIPGATVTFTPPASGATVTLGGSATVTTDSSGLATSPVLTAAAATGTFNVQAKVDGTTLAVNFSLTNKAAAPGSVTMKGGSLQSTLITTNFGQPLQALVKDTLGNPAPGVTVTFNLPLTGASGTFGSGTSTSVTAVTDANGIATSPTIKANTKSGNYFAEAKVAGVSQPATYSLTNLPGSAVSITIVQGNPQTTPVGSAFNTPLVVLVKDQYGNPVANAPVTFQAPASGASATFPGGVRLVTVSTDANGNATAPTTVANNSTGKFTITATIGNGNFVNFNLENGAKPNSIQLVGTGIQTTPINTAFGLPLTARVLDQSGLPVQGAVVRFVVPASGASAGLTSLTAVTNASGLASVNATANAFVGTYVVTASVTGVPGQANFALTNTNGAPHGILATGGNKQSTLVNTAFALPLDVTVIDIGGNPVPNVDVAFVAPGTGASAALSATTVKTNASGVASVNATANGTLGQYFITAEVNGVSTTLQFDLTNTDVLAALLVVRKSAPSPGLSVGEYGTYTLTVTNAGTADATTATIQDLLPAGLSLQSATGDNWSCGETSGLVSCDFSGGVIAASGGTAVVSVVVKPDPGTGGQSVTNYASVDPTGGNQPPDPGPGCAPSTSCASNTASITAGPDLTIAKSAPSPALFDGVDSTYTITVTNNGAGNATTATVQDKLPEGLNYVDAGNQDWSCGIVSGLVTCDFVGSSIGYGGGTSTIPVIVTPDLAAAGNVVTNYASVDPTGGSSPPEPGPDCAPAPSCASNESQITGIAAIHGVKTAALSGNVITYTITVNNTGTLSLTNVGITSDTLTRLDGASTVINDFGAGDFTTAGGATTTDLAPGASADFTATYTAVQADIDAGGVSNTATVEGTPPYGPPVTDITDNGNDGDGNTEDDPTQTTFPQSPALGLVKTGAVSQNGDSIEYTYTVTNTGNVTLTDVSVVEDQPSFTGTGTLPVPAYVSGGNGTGGLAPNDTMIWKATYTLTQADIDAGRVTNAADVFAKDPGGNEIHDHSDDSDAGPDDNDPTTTEIPQNPAIAVVKTGTVSQDGTTIDYSYVVTNTGNVTLTSVAVTENASSFTGTGTLPLPVLEGTAGPLEPNATQTFKASYTLTQDDIDAGKVTNQATASARDPSNADIEDLSDESGTAAGDNDPTVVAITQDARLAVVKTGVLSQDGSTIDYTYVVTNTGNVTLTDVNVTETQASFTGTGTLPVPVLQGTAGPLAPNGTMTYTASYTVTLSDADAGKVTNQATATARTPSGEETSDLSDESGTGPDDDDPTTVSITQSAVIGVVKTGALSPDGRSIEYTYVVTNLGNVTLTDVAVTEQQASFTGTGTLPVPELQGTSGPLEPNGTLTFKATYTLTQDDIDKGKVTNQAQASGKQPGGTEVSDLSDESTAGPDDNDPTTVEISQTAAVALVKTGKASPDDKTIDYTYVAINTGNVTLTDVTVTEEAAIFTGAGTLPAPVYQSGGNGSGGLAPGQSMTWTATYTLIQADLDNGKGSITNQAQVTAKDPAGMEVKDLSDGSSTEPGADEPTVTPFDPGAALAVVKTGVVSQDGNSIDYTYVVTNTGTVTLSEVAVTEVDMVFTGTGTPPVPAFQSGGNGSGGLAPGQSMTWAASYALTPKDRDAGSVTNQAKGTAKDPSDGSVEDLSDGSGTSPGDDKPTVTSISQTPAIAVVKTGALGADGNSIDYSYVVTNTGDVTLSGVTVTENKASFTGTGPLPVPAYQSGGDGSGGLAPGQSMTWTASYVLTPADRDAGSVTNQATAAGKSPSGADVSDLSDESGTAPGDNDPTVTAVTQSPAIAVVKTGAETQDGKTIDYTYVVTNTGNVTVTDVAVTETAASFTGTGPLPVPAYQGGGNGSGGLAPGQSMTWTASYAITQADIDKGSVTNQAEASATAPGGSTVRDLSDDSGTAPGDNDPTRTPIVQLASIAVVKTGELSKNGKQILFHFAVKNTGNVTLTNITLSDSLEGVTLEGGPIAELAPGVTDDTTFSAFYTVTAADFESGEVKNQAVVKGTTPGGTEVSDLSGTGFDNDDPTVVGSKRLIDEVRNKLTNALSDYLQGMMYTESVRFNDFSKRSADRLRSVEDCDESGAKDITGSLNGDNTEEGLSVNGSAAYHKYLTPCARRTRYMLDMQIDARYMNGTAAATASGALLRETLVSKDTVVGQFAGVYFDMPGQSDTYDGDITGVGLHGGVYGAHALTDRTIVDGYAAVSAGHQDFDLQFGDDLPIIAKGNSQYVAGYVGAALNGSMERGGYLFEPRAAANAAYALPWVNDLNLSQEQRREKATLDLPDLGLARISLESRISPLADPAGTDVNTRWAVTPLGFCQYDFGNDDELYCGVGLGLDLSHVNEEGDREVRLTLKGEAAPDHYLGSVVLRNIWYFDDRNGSSAVFLGLNQDGTPMGGYELNWRL